MLILSRRLGETIVINPGLPDEIRVTVMAIHGDKVRLGVQAAPEVTIHREEVAEKIAREGGRA